MIESLQVHTKVTVYYFQLISDISTFVPWRIGLHQPGHGIVDEPETRTTQESDLLPLRTSFKVQLHSALLV